MSATFKIDPAYIDLKSFAGNADFVLSLARGLKIVETFDTHKGGLSVAKAARQTGFSRAAARRILLTLESLGYAKRNAGVFHLTTRVLKLGFSFLSSATLPAIAQPILEHMTEILHESSSVSVLEGDQIVYVARSTAKRVMSIGLSVGSRLPAFCTSMGRMMLASLPAEEFRAYLDRVTLTAVTPKTITDKRRFAELIGKVRSNGYASVNEELELGLRSIAVPICTMQGDVVAAMNVGVHAGRISATELIRRVLPILRENAASLGRGISATLGELPAVTDVPLRHAQIVPHPKLAKPSNASRY